MNQFDPPIEVILEEIEKVAKRIKKAKEENDKGAYDLALKEHERLHKKYDHILYKKKEPTKVYLKRW